MNKKRRIRVWPVLLCVLVMFSVGLVKPTSAQKKKQKIPPGYTIIEGDMVLPVSLVEAIQRATDARQQPDAPTTTFQRFNFWPNGIVPFQFDRNVSAANQAAMHGAMSILENVANVDFQKCANNDCSGDYVHVQDADGNSSLVGRNGGQQDINIYNWDETYIIVHELMHCLGFYHEQSHADRDNFVEINCKNIKDGCSGDIFKRNFVIDMPQLTYGGYDFDSLMHYRQCAFSINNSCPTVSDAFPDGGLTIRVKEPYRSEWQTRIGQRDHLSALDQATLSFLYRFPNWRFFDTTYNGVYGAPNGHFFRPYNNFAQAVADTPIGGTLWLLQTQRIPAIGTYNKQITIKAAPKVVGTLGN